MERKYYTWRYEEKQRRREDNVLLQDCVQDLDKRDENRNKWKVMRRKFFERGGWSVGEVLNMINAGVNVETELRKRGEDNEAQQQNNKIDNSSYNKIYRHTRTTGLPIYLKRKSKELHSIARWRVGNEELANRYWIFKF